MSRRRWLLTACLILAPSAQGQEQGQGVAAEEEPCTELENEDYYVPNPDQIELTCTEIEMIYYTNVARAQRGRRPMVVNLKLMNGSRNWAQRNAIDNAPNRHSGANVAENAFHTVKTARAAVAGWVASPGHLANIVGPYTKIGVGVAYSKRGVPHWIQQFIW